MGKKSEYNTTLKLQKTAKFRELESLLPTYVHPYLDSMLVDYQINTLIAYTRDLITFFEFLSEMNPTLKGLALNQIPECILENLTIQDITEYRNYLSANEGIYEHSNQASSIERRMAPLRGFFQDAYLNGFLKVNPAILQNRHKRRRREKHEIIYMNNNEVSNFVHTVENSLVESTKQQKFCQKTQLRDTAIITLMLNTGIRISECVGIDMEDLSFLDNSVKVVRKGGHEATIYFNEKVANALDAYIKLERPRFISEANEKALFLSSQKKRMAIRSIQVMVKKFAKESVHNKNISAHKLRSTYGSALYQATSDIYTVSERLGHSDISTSAKHYTAMTQDRLKEAGQIEPY